MSDVLCPDNLRRPAVSVKDHAGCPDGHAVGAPWAEWAQPWTREVCEIDSATEFGAGSPETITCRTTYSREAGFDGDFPACLGEIDAAGRASGWHEDRGGRQSAVDYYRVTEAQAGKVDAGSVPAVSYLVPEPAPGTTGCTSPGYVGESWVERTAAAGDGHGPPVPPPVRHGVHAGHRVPAQGRLAHGPKYRHSTSAWTSCARASGSSSSSIAVSVTRSTRPSPVSGN